MGMYTIELALPVPLARNFSYLSKSLPPKGARVRVPFGAGNRKLIGIHLGEAKSPPEGIELKEVDSILDPEVPILSPALVKLGFWLSEYYLHPLGEVFKTMLPSSVKKKVIDHYVIASVPEEHKDFVQHLFKNRKKSQRDIDP